MLRNSASRLVGDFIVTGVLAGFGGPPRGGPNSGCWATLESI